MGNTCIRFNRFKTNIPGVDQVKVQSLERTSFRFKTKSLGVDLYKVQDQFTWGTLSIGSELGKDDLTLGTKSLRVELY